MMYFVNNWWSGLNNGTGLMLRTENREEFLKKVREVKKTAVRTGWAENENGCFFCYTSDPDMIDSFIISRFDYNKPIPGWVSGKAVRGGEV